VPASDLKVYVEVVANFDPDGRLRPLSLTWEDGQRYDIDRVLEVRPAAAQKAGGQGDRYTVRILGRDKYLFFEHSTRPAGNRLGRWFVERHTAD